MKHNKNMIKEISRNFKQIIPPPENQIYSYQDSEEQEQNDFTDALMKIHQLTEEMSKEKEMPESKKLKITHQPLALYDDFLLEMRVFNKPTGKRIEIGYHKAGKFHLHNDYGPALMNETNLNEDNYFCEIAYYLYDIKVTEEDVIKSGNSEKNKNRSHDFHIGIMQ